MQRRWVRHNDQTLCCVAQNAVLWSSAFTMIMARVSHSGDGRQAVCAVWRALKVKRDELG